MNISTTQWVRHSLATYRTHSVVLKHIFIASTLNTTTMFPWAPGCPSMRSPSLRAPDEKGVLASGCVIATDALSRITHQRFIFGLRAFMCVSNELQGALESWPQPGSKTVGRIDDSERSGRVFQYPGQYHSGSGADKALRDRLEALRSNNRFYRFSPVSFHRPNDQTDPSSLGTFDRAWSLWSCPT